MPWRPYPARRRPAIASSTARGYGVAHRRRRAALLARSPWCIGFPAGVHGDTRVRATVADHRTSMRRGGSPAGPLDPMCRSCNSRKAVAIEGARPR